MPRLCAVIFCLLAVLGVASAHAQKRSDPPKSPGEIMELGSAAFRVPKTSKFYRELFGMAKGKAGVLPVQEYRGIGKSAKPLKIVKHYRGPDDQGIPMPGPDEALHPLEGKNRSLAGLGKRLKAAFAAYEKKVQDPDFLPFNGRALPACYDHKTEKKKIPKDPALIKKLGGGQALKNENNDTVFIDLLFVAEGDFPISPGEVFGRQVAVRKVTDEDTQAAIAIRKMAQSVGATCLPYRIRITPDYLFKHFGTEALKNFDKNPGGKGKFHEVMKPKAEARTRAKKGKKQ